MRKYLLSLFLLFVILLPSKVVFANTSSNAISQAMPTIVQYTLPYPGILPDNPLYGLKIIRDNIIGFFISDPLRKAEFYILQSDKRLEASWYLEKENSKAESLVVSTLSKSTNYLSLAVSQIQQAKASGESTSAVVEKAQLSLAKHLEILTQMTTMLASSNTAAIASEEKRVKQLQQQVTAFRM